MSTLEQTLIRLSRDMLTSMNDMFALPNKGDPEWRRDLSNQYYGLSVLTQLSRLANSGLSPAGCDALQVVEDGMKEIMGALARLPLPTESRETETYDLTTATGRLQARRAAEENDRSR